MTKIRYSTTSIQDSSYSAYSGISTVLDSSISSQDTEYVGIRKDINIDENISEDIEAQSIEIANKSIFS